MPHPPAVDLLIASATECAIVEGPTLDAQRGQLRPAQTTIDEDKYDWAAGGSGVRYEAFNLLSTQIATKTLLYRRTRSDRSLDRGEPTIPTAKPSTLDRTPAGNGSHLA